jgi:hypothetical protein
MNTTEFYHWICGYFEGAGNAIEPEVIKDKLKEVLDDQKGIDHKTDYYRKNDWALDYGDGRELSVRDYEYDPSAEQVAVKKDYPKVVKFADKVAKFVDPEIKTTYSAYQYLDTGNNLQHNAHDPVQKHYTDAVEWHPGVNADQ